LRDEQIELKSILVSITGDYPNTRVKLVLDSVLKNIAPVQKANEVKDNSEIHPLSEFKYFDEDDRAYLLAHFEIDTTNKDVFEQIQLLINLQYKNEEFYYSPEMRRIVWIIVSNHMLTKWPNA
jgi:hypothetical protein